MNRETQQQVDQLLMEQGQYSPLEYLLQEGRLMYNDYEMWRNGEIECLSEVLFGDTEQIKIQLKQAENYVQQLGLAPTNLRYHKWGNDGEENLYFSSDPEFNRCFHSQYNKADDQHQLDMFIDAPAVNLAQGVKLALANRNIIEARRQLNTLTDISPDYAQLGDLERLVESGETITEAVSDIGKDLFVLQNEIIPLAETVLLKECRNFVVPFWRRLSAVLSGCAFDSQQPMHHLSYTALMAQDWQIVKQAVENETNWQTEPKLITRHAHACTRLRLKKEALISWFLLCWLAPDDANIIEKLANSEIVNAWTRFLELEPELPVQTFPAWLLLHKPSLANILDLTEFEQLSFPIHYKTFKCSYELATTLNHKQQHKDNIALRAQLQQHEPELFKHFLKPNQ